MDRLTLPLLAVGLSLLGPAVASARPPVLPGCVAPSPAAVPARLRNTNTNRIRTEISGRRATRVGIEPNERRAERLRESRLVRRVSTELPESPACERGRLVSIEVTVSGDGESAPLVYRIPYCLD